MKKFNTQEELCNHAHKVMLEVGEIAKSIEVNPVLDDERLIILLHSEYEIGNEQTSENTQVLLIGDEYKDPPKILFSCFKLIDAIMKNQGLNLDSVIKLLKKYFELEEQNPVKNLIYKTKKFQ